jgi:hypothetical protein
MLRLLDCATAARVSSLVNAADVSWFFPIFATDHEQSLTLTGRPSPASRPSSPRRRTAQRNGAFDCFVAPARADLRPPGDGRQCTDRLPPGADR